MAPQSPSTHRSASARRALLSSFAGTTMEWYDFFIYGTAAALVFGKVFFPDVDPITGTLLSLSTFSIAFVARPLGGVIFGHFGDRVGRKSILIITISLMGGATCLIGLVPSYETLGVAAPVLLVLLRLIQGLALGGEYSGAVLMSVEHAKKDQRGLYGAIVNSGAWWGLLLATLVFFAVAGLPDESFEAWGWRVPFLVGGVLLTVALYIRLSVQESPDFEEVKRRNAVNRVPVVDVFRNHRGKLALMVLSYLSAGATFYVVNVFSLTYSKVALELDRTETLQYILAATVVTMALVPFFGWLSDRISRKLIYVVSIPAMCGATYLWFALLDTGTPALMFLAYLLISLPICAYYGTMAAFFAGIFPAEVRFSGLAVGYTLGAVLGSAAAPLVATYLLGRTGDWMPIALYLTGLAVFSLAASLFLNERFADSASPVESAEVENQATTSPGLSGEAAPTA
jgi:metabolite-proton symporter